MVMEVRESCIKKTLRDLCLSNGWSYSVFWRFDPRNHMMLTMEDAYYEEHAGDLVDDMLLQLHMLGEGNIGQAALDGKHRWLFLDHLTQNHKFLGHTKKHDTSLGDFEFGFQFSSGIKTIAVIPVELQGVVQFGSTNAILETPEFLNQARKCFEDKNIMSGVAPAGIASSSFKTDICGQNGQFASLISSTDSVYADVSTSLTHTIESMGSCSMFDSLDVPGRPFDAKSTDECGDGELITSQKVGPLLKETEVTRDICEDIPSNLQDTFVEQLGQAHLPSPSFDPCQMDELSQWLADSSKLCVTGLDAILSDDMSHTLGIDCISSGLGASDMFPSIQGNQLASSSQSSLCDALDSYGKGKSLDMPANNDELLAQFGIDFGCGKLGENLEDIINLVGDKSNPLPVGSGLSISECIPEVGHGSVATPRKRLFSELGLEHLLKDVATSSSITGSCIDDQWPTSKRGRIESYQPINNQIHELTFGSLKDCMPKTQTGSWTNDSYSMDAKSCISRVNAQTRRPEEPVKSTKKRSKPGESTRPRPKDRQMIADRIKELREIIPNGAKLSIDALLGHTIKHMLFLQNLTKHADKLKQVDEPKLVSHDNGLVRKSSSTSICSRGNGSRGTTWAYEVTGSNLFCPIIVEDLSHPGQMLIEMLCEERGYFLEIADIVQGFGLTILKGVMEAREDKIWAHFVVEGHRHVTRMEVFLSLMQLFQGTASSEVNTSGETGNAVNTHTGVPLWNNYHQQQHLVPLPT